MEILREQKGQAQVYQWAVVISGVNDGLWIAAFKSEVKDPSLMALVAEKDAKANMVVVRLTGEKMQLYRPFPLDPSLLVVDRSRDMIGIIQDGKAQRIGGPASDVSAPDRPSPKKNAAPRGQPGDSPEPTSPDRRPPTRLFTDRDGRTVEAEFLGVADGQVLVRRKLDGKEFTIPLEKLSEKDQLWVKQPQSPIPDRGAPRGPTASGRALGSGATRDLFLLLQMKDVRKEIKLSSKQLENVKEIARWLELEEQEHELHYIRSDPQEERARLKELKDVTEKLEAQKAKLPWKEPRTRRACRNPHRRLHRKRVFQGLHREKHQGNIEPHAIEAAEASPAPSGGTKSILRPRGTQGAER